uniref:Uncharacterized protein n=1 Tax=Mucochytrium quahogii TaxID=96639 RepID=A0A7S2SKG3_9STRA|mmetsp:Transcript_55/g.135  ORF Transcript_55/g.135 Transcript_55/m.135 type:complete len:326 (+) Transcript_55:48-1025(+)
MTSKYFAELVDNLPDLKGKVVAITGTTSGTGFVAARVAAEKNATVLLLNRPSERAVNSLESLKQAVPQGSFEAIDCDLSDFDSVLECAEKIRSNYDALYVLINNAGIMAVADKATKQGYDQQMQVNTLSPFLLTRELFPLLEKGAGRFGEARVVNHSSIARLYQSFDRKYYEKNGGNLGGDFAFMMLGARWTRYKQSKLGNCLFTYAMKERLDKQGSKVKSMVAHPGAAKTNLINTTAKDGGAGSLDTKMVSWFGQTSEDGAMGIIKCAFLPDVPSGAFLGPKRCISYLATTGEAVPLKPEKNLTKESSLRDFWEACEAACGDFL